MQKVFIDTSAWIAYYLASDPNHNRVAKLFKQLIQENVIICTSNDVIDETVTRLIYTTNPSVVNKFTSFISESILTKNLIQFWADEQVQTDAFVQAAKFSEHKLSLTDATTLVLIKNFGINSIVTLDSDFTKVGIHSLP